MSKHPSQHAHTSTTNTTKHPLTVITRPPTEYQHQPPMARPYQPYLPREPPPFLFPDSHNSDPTMRFTMPNYSLPLHGKARDVAGHRQSAMPPANPPEVLHRSAGSMDYSAGPSYYNDASSSRVSYSRSSIGSGGRLNDADSAYSSSNATFPSPVYSDRSTATYSSSLPTSISQPQTQLQPQPQRVKPGMPIGFDKLLHHSPEPTPVVSQPQPPPPQHQQPSGSRYHLHIRQQPIAARACGAGDRDRRPVDPPPILQMLLSDFNPGSTEDREILEDPRFTVSCLLYPVIATGSTTSTTTTGLDNMRYFQPEESPDGPHLSGKAFVSPFFVPNDPDPATCPAHPVSSSFSSAQPYQHQQQQQQQQQQKQRQHAANSTGLPSTFFIFSDLSIRSAGLYRFQFRLMNWGAIEDSGGAMPILAETWSDAFRVYPAKDFPGMRDSSVLAEGLKEAGFVELKTRGKGRGKGRRRGR